MEQNNEDDNENVCDQRDFSEFKISDLSEKLVKNWDDKQIQLEIKKLLREGGYNGSNWDCDRCKHTADWCFCPTIKFSEKYYRSCHNDDHPNMVSGESNSPLHLDHHFEPSGYNSEDADDLFGELLALDEDIADNVELLYFKKWKNKKLQKIIEDSVCWRIVVKEKLAENLKIK